MPEPLSSKQRLGHKGDRLIISFATFFKDIFKPHELVPHLDQGPEFHVDLRLAGRGHFMMLGLYFYAKLLQDHDHLSPQVLLAVGRGYREVAFFMSGFIPQLGDSARPLFQIPSTESIS